MVSFKDSFSLPHSFSPEQAEKINQFIGSKNIANGQIILRNGETFAKSYFVQKGCLRSYTIDEKGKEHILMFAPEGWIVSDISARLGSTSYSFFIDAIEDSIVEVIDQRLFELLESIAPEARTIANQKLINHIVVLQKRIIMLMSASAWERYQHFIETYPNILQRVPQRMIASYLGVTPEALSKLRGDNAKK